MIQNETLRLTIGTVGICLLVLGAVIFVADLLYVPEPYWTELEERRARRGGGEEDAYYYVIHVDGERHVYVFYKDPPSIEVEMQELSE